MFKTFPEFSKLTLADREEYESFIKDFQPVADISFGSLMTWWNELHPVKVAQLNGNLVIQYWSHEDERNSGLSLVGTNKVDESICEIFDYLSYHNFPIRLVNIPHFVIEHIAYSNLFNFKEQRDYFEYIMNLDKFYPLSNLRWYRRKKVEKQLERFADLEIRQLDLGIEDNHKLALDMIDATWDLNINNFGRLEKNALMTSILRSEELSMENVCLFLDEKVQGICLFQRPNDSEFIIVNHLKAGAKSLVGYELIAYLLAEWFTQRGVKYINLDTDAGLMRLRMFMLAIGPLSFFRKYIVEPV